MTKTITALLCAVTLIMTGQYSYGARGGNGKGKGGGNDNVWVKYTATEGEEFITNPSGVHGFDYHIVGTVNRDTIFGSSFRDFIEAGDDRDAVSGLGGHDEINGDDGSDHIDGGDDRSNRSQEAI